jgi:inosine-uridine nucleoside N-ribohydrolase
MLIPTIYAMGGACLGKGDTSNFMTEFNAYTDPEAYFIVFNQHRQIVLLPYDSMFDVQPEMDELDKIFNGTTEKAKFIKNIYDAEKIKTKYLFLCDPLTMAIALAPDTVTAYHNKFVAIELRGVYSQGNTVVDWMGFGKDLPQCYIPVGLDKEKIY